MRALSAKTSIVLSMLLLTYFVTNQCVYPRIAITSASSARDIATLAGVAILIAIAFFVARAPRLLNTRTLTIMAAACAVAYGILCEYGLRAHALWAIYAGTLLDSTAESWAYILVYAMASQLDDKHLSHTVVGTFFFVYLLGFLFSGFLAGATSVLAGAMLAVICIVAFPCTRGPLESIKLAQPQADLLITEPRSFLSTNHPIFIAILVFNISEGAALALSTNIDGLRPFGYGFVLIPLAVIGLLTILKKRRGNIDVLFSSTAVIVLGGYMLIPVGQIVIESPIAISTILLDAGAVCFNMLTIELIATIASRNKLATVTLAAQSTALSWLGIELGTLVIAAMQEILPSNPQATTWMSFVLAMAFSSYCFVVLRNFSFESVIKGVQPTSMTAESSCGKTSTQSAMRGSGGTVDEATSAIDAGCEFLAKRYALTPRELDVLLLLARGRTVSVIQQRLQISINTVRFHTKNIYAKIGVHSQQELINMAEEAVIEASSNGSITQ